MFRLEAASIPRIFAAVRPVDRNTIKSSPHLQRELRDIRRKGYALEDHEHTDGVRAVAAALVNPAGRATCAVAVEGPVHLLADPSLPHIVASVQAAARTISDYIVHSDRQEHTAPSATASAAVETLSVGRDHKRRTA